MNPLKIILHLCLALVLIPQSGFASGEPPEPFNKDELEQFCRSLPDVLNSLNNQEQQQYLIEVTSDPENTFFQREPERSFASSLSASRFNYILNHAILAGFVNEMGGFGEEKITFMKQQREKITYDSTIDETEKEQILNELDSGILEMTRLHQQTKSIPKSELFRLWRKKDVLNSHIKDIFPVEKKKMVAR